MLDYISEKIANWLSKENAIVPEDKDLYKYAVCIFITTSLPLFIIIGIYCILGYGLQGGLILIPFLTIRKYSGGYHAKTAISCFFLSTMLCMAFLLFAIHIHSTIFLRILLGLSFFSLAKLSPINSENRILSLEEQKYYKVKTRKIVRLYILIYIVLYIIHSNYAVYIAFGIIFASTLQLPCIIKKYIHSPQKNTTH